MSHKEYTLIRKRTLTEPHIVILYTGTQLQCQYWLVSHSDVCEYWPKGEIGDMLL